MGGQAIERREVLRFIGMASAAAAFPGFQRWVFACSRPSRTGLLALKDAYKPLFFSPEQFRMVEHLTEMIIPSDESPGAKEAGVAEFVDFMLANRVSVYDSDSYQPTWQDRYARTTEGALRIGAELQRQFLLGLSWLNARSKSQIGHEFMDCSGEQQNSLLEELAYPEKYQTGTETGREFFQLARDYTVVGYYTSKIGLTSLGYPGLQTSWPSMPGCTHPDNPEHANLSHPGSMDLAKQNTGLGGS